MEVEKLAVLAFSSARDDWFCWEWTLYTLTFHWRLRYNIYKSVLTLASDVEKDEDVMQDPKDVGLVHGEESLETPKKLKGTALR